MSHFKQRKEKNCLNCSAEVQGRFCQNCGQENIEPTESVWDLVSHFFKDITHFDGKFFNSMKYLITRPGFLTKEYMAGRRASYVNPVRMYIFTSAFFFLLFFSFFKIDNKAIVTLDMNGKTFAQIEAMDSLAFNAFTKIVNKEAGKPALPMSRTEFKKYFDSSMEGSTINFTSVKYKSKAHYDSVLKSGKIKHNWLLRRLIYKEIEINKKYKNNKNEGLNTLGNILLHSLPQILFILLPIFAGILKLLYIRRKKYYYVNHGIFSVHFYIFSFIDLLFIFGIAKLNEELKWTILPYIEVILGLGIFFYLYKSMRNFYMQRRAKTVFKFLILCFLLFIAILFLFLAFVFYSIFKL